MQRRFTDLLTTSCLGFMSQSLPKSPALTKPMKRRSFLAVGGGVLAAWALGRWATWPTGALRTLRAQPLALTLSFDRTRTRPGRWIELSARWAGSQPLPEGAVVPIGLIAGRRGGPSVFGEGLGDVIPAEVMLPLGWSGNTRLQAPLLDMDALARAQEGYALTARLLLGDDLEAASHSAPFVDVIVSPFSIGG